MNNITRIALFGFSCVNRIQCRHRGGVRKVFRQKLPRYKNTLFSLPEPVESHTDLAKLWADKSHYYKAYMPPNQQFVLLDALLNPNNNIDQLLRIIDENVPTMNSFYLAVSFEVLYDMAESGSCDSETILVSPEFKRLCQSSLTRMRFLDADEVLKVVSCLSKVKVPEDTLISQSALQMTRHLINDFNSRELAILERSLADFEVISDSRQSLLVALRRAISITAHQRLHGSTNSPDAPAGST